MVKRNFTDKEKIVFYGIIKYPNINDNALSKIIDVNQSTIATIRNKLKKKNYFQFIRIPFLQTSPAKNSASASVAHSQISTSTLPSGFR